MDWAGVMMGIAAAGLIALAGLMVILVIELALCLCRRSGEISQREENYAFTKGEKRS